jgi:hypothetical protein
MSSNTLVWIDHHEARLFDVAQDRQDVTTVSAPPHHVHRHPKGASAEHNHAGDAVHFYDEVAHALERASHILLVGPSTAKLQFLRHLTKHHPRLDAKVVGIETVDHPSDGQLIAHAKRYFGLPSPRV